MARHGAGNGHCQMVCYRGCVVPEVYIRSKSVAPRCSCCVPGIREFDTQQYQAFQGVRVKSNIEKVFAWENELHVRDNSQDARYFWSPGRPTTVTKPDLAEKAKRENNSYENNCAAIARCNWRTPPASQLCSPLLNPGASAANLSFKAVDS